MSISRERLDQLVQVEEKRQSEILEKIPEEASMLIGQNDHLLRLLLSNARLNVLSSLVQEIDSKTESDKFWREYLAKERQRNSHIPSETTRQTPRR